MRAISLDFETTGTVRGWPNEPWQLGMIEIDDDGVVPQSQREFYFRIDAERPFSPCAPGRWAQIRHELAAADEFMETWPELSALLVGRALVAHNASTERTILEKRAPLTPFGPWLDTLRMTRKYWPRMKSYALGDLIHTFGLEKQLNELCPGRTWHDALYDACAGAVLFCHIRGVRSAE